MTNTFIDFINVNKKDPKVQIKINDMLDRFNRLPYNYQSKIGYDTLIQNVFLKELINIMGTTIRDLDIKLKKKISRIEYLESRLICLCSFLFSINYCFYVTENNCRCYRLTFQNNGKVKVQKFENISSDEKTIYSVKPMTKF